MTKYVIIWNTRGSGKFYADYETASSKDLAKKQFRSKHSHTDYIIVAARTLREYIKEFFQRNKLRLYYMTGPKQGASLYEWNQFWNGGYGPKKRGLPSKWSSYPSWIRVYIEKGAISYIGTMHHVW